MKVFFGCDARNILKYKDSYRHIRDAILKAGHTVTRDWIDEWIEKVEKEDTDSEVQYYSQTVESLLVADVVIIEGSIESTSLGHQLSLALEKNKPTLYLSQQSLNELKNDFIVGLQSPYLTFKSYTNEEVEKIVFDFLSQNDGEIKTRFNLVMDKTQDNYLEWAAYTYKKSKTELIKEAITDQLQKDERYQEYLGQQV